MKMKDELNGLNGEAENRNKKLTPLTEEELAQVAGGDLFDEFSQWLTSDMDYKSGDTPKFKPGRRVIFYYGLPDKFKKESVVNIWRIAEMQN